MNEYKMIAPDIVFDGLIFPTPSWKLLQYQEPTALFVNMKESIVFSVTSSNNPFPGTGIDIACKSWSLKLISSSLLTVSFQPEIMLFFYFLMYFKHFSSSLPKFHSLSSTLHIYLIQMLFLFVLVQFHQLI